MRGTEYALTVGGSTAAVVLLAHTFVPQILAALAAVTAALS